MLDHKLARGEVGTVLVLSAARSQARTVFRYALGFLEGAPMLAREVESVTQDEIRLRSGVEIATHVNSFRSVRGRTILAAIFDEVDRSRAMRDDPEAAESEWQAQFRSDIDAFLDDGQIMAAVDMGRPRELPPRPGISYSAFTDASGGRSDSYARALVTGMETDSLRTWSRASTPVQSFDGYGAPCVGCSTVRAPEH